MALLSRREFLDLIGRGSLLLPLAGILKAVPVSASGDRSLARLKVNGVDVFHRLGRDISLLDFLRTDLGLKGSKYGCGVGACGACTVLIDGRPVRSCLVNAAHLEGRSVTTIEGLGGPGRLDLVQRIFADLGVFQCGYCAPGFVLVTRALLDRNPDPDEMEIRRALAGNLCRCTGYRPIVEAVRAMADPDRLSVLGKRFFSGPGVGRPDLMAEAKVTGRLVYAGDHELPGMAWARVVWSSRAHALIDKVDIGPAAQTPGVIKVLTSRDVPGRNLFGSVIPDQPVLAGDRVRFYGDAVALVVAESKAAAGLAAGRVKVAYRDLPAVFSPDRALEPGAPLLTDQGNLCAEVEHAKGLIPEGRKQARAIVTRTYQTPLIEHAYLEPESCLSHVDEDGYLVVTTASQAPMSFRDQIADICALARDRVRMRTSPAGGAFGGKGDLTIQHLCALATVTTGLAVSLELTREESIRVSIKRHPLTLTYETGADEKGRLTHCRVRGLADAGAYHSASMVVVDDAAVFATGPYQIDHIDVKIRAAFTNNPTCGAMRGFGVPQVCLAMERQIDELARELGIDPLEMRLLNALDQGRVSQWGQVMGPGVGVTACLKALKKAVPKDRDLFKPGPDEIIGLGYAACYKNTSTPTHIPFGRADVDFVLNRQGRFVIYVGSSELGQGLVTALTRIAAEKLGVPQDLFEVVFGSTTRTSSQVLTTSSQATFLTGGAVFHGASGFRKLLIESAAEVFSLDRDRLALGPKGFWDSETKKELVSYANLAWRAGLAGRDLSWHFEYVPPVSTMDAPKMVEKIGPDQIILPSLGYGAQAALVAVDLKSGQVRVLKIYAAQDVGRAINPNAVAGQILGGVVMGLGWCLKEKVILSQGRILNQNLDTYFVPRSRDIPEIETLIVEVPDPLGPMGAKGLGEVPLLPTAPAVLNAILDAVGLGLDEIPVSAAVVRQQLDRNRS